MSDASIPTAGTAYRDLRERVGALMGTLDAAVMREPSPATPEWLVRDVLAHLVGVTNDVVNGKLEGVASDAWTGAQVAARRDASTADLLAEWDDYGPRFETLLDTVPPEISGQALFDAATHEHDLRTALGTPGARDSAAMVVGWSWIIMMRGRGDGPTLRFVTDVGDVLAGAGEPVARVEASRFELMRAMTGRRTESEMRAYRWTPEPHVDLLLAAPFFTPCREPLGE